MILFATIAGSFCNEPVNVESNTPQAIKEADKEAQPQKRHVISDCDGPGGVVGLQGGFHGDAIHGDLALGLHGHSYAPSYSGGYLASGAIASHIGSLHGDVGHYGSVGHIGHVSGLGGISGLGSISGLGALVSAPNGFSSGYAPNGFSSGYAPHAPILASSVVSHAPVISHVPYAISSPVRFFISINF